MRPIFPMEPMSSDKIPTGDEWIANIKWDGVRILSYYDGLSVTLLNRKQNERTNHYPELADIHSYCHADSVILDGEIIALGQDGKPSFHEVMRSLLQLSETANMDQLVARLCLLTKT